MDSQHLALELTGLQDIPQLLGHPQSLDISLQYDHQTSPTSEEDVNFPSEPQISGKDPISRFYAQDGPWTPLRYTQLPNARGKDTFGQGCSSVARSDFDSGYGSYGPHPSVTNGSACDDALDTVHDTQSIAGTSIADTAFPGPENPWRQPTQAHIPFESDGIKCETCSQVLRTKSELKKHSSRHTKPFKCDAVGCARQGKGFGTKNDLERHKRSVHPGSEADGSRYVCRIGPCSSKVKIWPRADNFKAHLKRIHNRVVSSEEELETFLHRQLQEDARQASLNDFPHIVYGETQSWQTPFGPTQNIGSAEILGHEQRRDSVPLTHSYQNPNDLELSPQMISEPGLYQNIEGFGANIGNDEVQSKIGMHQGSQIDAAAPERNAVNAHNNGELAEEPILESRRADAVVSETKRMENSSQGQQGSDEAIVAEFERKETFGSAMKTNMRPPATIKTRNSLPSSGSSFPADFQDREKIKGFLNELENRGLLRSLGYTKLACQESEPPKAEPANDSTYGHMCHLCKKRFPRRCELKKHEKRHEKPYGCTYKGCDKKFGSKNDWKRHENTQHFWLETWKCIAETPGCEPCGKVCYSEQSFRSHLEGEHRFQEGEPMNAFMDKCRIGRNFKDRFWCGFCNALIDIIDENLAAWVERFNHIDEHYTGREHRDISEWVEYDQSKQAKSQQQKEDLDHTSNESTSRPSQLNAKIQPQPLNPEPGTSNAGHSGRKRKSGEGGKPGGSKKSKPAVSIPSCVPTWKCCQCDDGLFTDLSIQCCNYPCDHRPCANCIQCR